MYVCILYCAHVKVVYLRCCIYDYFSQYIKVISNTDVRMEEGKNLG